MDMQYALDGFGGASERDGTPRRGEGKDKTN